MTEQAENVIKNYPLMRDGLTELKKILYEYNSHPIKSLMQLEDTAFTIKISIRDLKKKNSENKLSENDELLLKILILIYDDLERIWDRIYRDFDEAAEIFDSLEAAYFSESIEECAFEDYLKRVKHD
jgi:Na+/phosphate symporter